MTDLTAARDARNAAILDRAFTTPEFSMSWREAIDTGVIAYGRIRTFSSGKRTYGVILAEDVDTDDPFYSSFYDAPKTVVDACPNVVTN